MAKTSPLSIWAAVEGTLDEAVVRRLIVHVGAEPGPIHGKNGKPHLLRQVKAYNEAARYKPWIVLVDLDDDEVCAPPFRANWLPCPAPQMCFRVAVREVEAWLLADRERLARFLSVSLGGVPPEPEAIADPKRVMVDLARRSRKREIREEMVPRPESGRPVGPAYSSHLMEFVADTTAGWRPDAAAESSESLRRCIHALHALVEPAS
jgi:hypothetical protein